MNNYRKIKAGCNTQHTYHTRVRQYGWKKEHRWARKPEIKGFYSMNDIESFIIYNFTLSCFTSKTALNNHEARSVAGVI